MTSAGKQGDGDGAKAPKQQGKGKTSMPGEERPHDSGSDSGASSVHQQQSSAVPSYHMQQQLGVNATIARLFFDCVLKGDVDAVKKQENRMGLDVQYQMDGELQQNANFFATQISDTEKAIKMVRWLFSKGCKIGLTDTLGQTCLFYAARDGRLPLVSCLIELGVDINQVDAYGQTAFFYACREGHIDVCKLLADCGTDADLPDNEGQTPLYYAIMQSWQSAVAFLLERGVDVDHRDGKQVTPYILAKTVGKQEIILQLVEAGAKTNEDYQTTTVINALHGFSQSRSTQRRKNAALAAAAEVAEIRPQIDPSERCAD